MTRAYSLRAGRSSACQISKAGGLQSTSRCAVTMCLNRGCVHDPACTFCLLALGFKGRGQPRVSMAQSSSLRLRCHAGGSRSAGMYAHGAPRAFGMGMLRTPRLDAVIEDEQRRHVSSPRAVLAHTTRTLAATIAKLEAATLHKLPYGEQRLGPLPVLPQPIIGLPVRPRVARLLSWPMVGGQGGQRVCYQS